MKSRKNWRMAGEAIVAVVLAAPAFTAIAQQAQPEQEPQAEQQPGQAPGAPGGDVPGRVARLNYFDGAVTFEPAGGTEWAYAELNRPLTTGDQVWVDNGGRSELHIGSTALRLGQQSALSIVNLDDQNAQLKLAQGTLETRLRTMPAGQSFEVDTPNLALQADGPGVFRVDASPDGTSTTVTVREGNLTAYGDSGSVQIGPGQQVTFSGTNLQEAGGSSAQPPDAFETWADSRDHQEDTSVSARYVSRDVPGYEDLDANGSWEDAPDYGGQVWVPRVAAGWAPYHEGHWAWVAPWGWTWVDDAPWGFAPFHYGRWAYYHNNWAWVPGPVVVSAPPCYSPALVAFVGGGGGGGPGWGVSLTVGAVAAGVAWLPLGPGEPWRPAYHYSPGYYNRVNYGGHNTTIVNNINVHNTYINRNAPRAITGMPANQFVRGQGAGRYGQFVPAQQVAHNSFGAGAPAIAPVRESFGGALRPANVRPPQAVAGRPVIATRNAPTPYAYHDTLAQNFARSSAGRVPGAGQPVVRTAAPANFARVANVPAQAGQAPRGAPANERGATAPAFRVVPAERRPMPVQAQANRGAPVAPRPGQPEMNEANGARPAAQAGRPAEVPAAQQPRENGVPHPPGVQAGRPGEQPNGAQQAGQRGQQPQAQSLEQQRAAHGQQQAEQQRAQQSQQAEQQRTQQGEQQRVQQQAEQQRTQQSQQAEQQRAQQGEQQRAQQQAEQQRTQQSQQAEQQRAQQQAEQQRAQQSQQAAQQREQQAQQNQQRAQQQAEQQQQRQQAAAQQREPQVQSQPRPQQERPQPQAQPHPQPQPQPQHRPEPAQSQSHQNGSREQHDDHHG